MSVLRWQAPGGPTLVGERHSGAGPLVVLLHGGFQNRSAWRSAVPELQAAGYEVVTYDLRGHGDSDRSPTGRYDVADHAADLRALLELLDRPAALIGASLGGGAALSVAGHRDRAVRDRVAALVLVDVVPRLEEGGRDRVRAFAADHAAGFASLEDAAQRVASYVGGTPRAGRGLERSLVLGEDGRYRWHWDPALVDEGFDAYGDQLVADQLAASRRLELPTLLLRGGSSDVTSPGAVAEFLAAAPKAVFREIPEVGHMVSAMPNHPYLTAAAEFLSGLDLPTAR
ncbi:alpha/beta fold hydrolase [Nocardioides humi]|uniref:Alpha/beta hydrolase n=1 Tax=Nocardioides humi TaxID=449461 RepID=A0ABN2AG58_9ACTN|nr:alpha/beta fold hydrolase [Nocardioides humi]